MTVTCDVSEVRALARDITRNADQTPARARAVVAAGAERVVAAIKTEILALDLIETSNMLDDTTADVDGTGFEAGSTAEYTVYQDQGTSELPASNFHAKGFDKVFPSIEDGLADLGASILGRA